MKKLLAAVSLALLWSACSNSGNESNRGLPTDSTVTGNSEKTGGRDSVTYFKMAGDEVMILPFEIEVQLSPKAREKIMASKETIVVAVYFTGIPRDSSKVKLGEDGSFNVAYATREISYGQIAKFEDIKFPGKIYDQLADKDIDVTVNVYSGRRSSTDNLLDCDALFEKISKVVNKKILVKGKLIYGDD
jgi:hypothetical protein